MAKSTSTGLSKENGSEQLDDDMDLLGPDLTEGDDWDDSLDQDAVERPKKKSGMFNILIILIGILIFGGIVYSKLTTVPQGRGTPSVAPTEGPSLEGSSPIAQTPATPTPVATDATEAGPLTPMPDFAATAPTTPPTDPISGPAPLSVSGTDIIPPVVTLTPNDPVSPTLDAGEKEGAVVSVPVTGSVPDSQLASQKIVQNNDLSQEFSAVPGAPVGVVHPLNDGSTTPNSKNLETEVKDLDPRADDKIRHLEIQLSELSKRLDAQKPNGPISSDQVRVEPDSDTMALLADQVKSLSDRLEVLERNAPSVPAEGSPEHKTQNTYSGDISNKAALTEDADHADIDSFKPDITATRPIPKVHYILRGVSGDTAYVGRSTTSPVIRVQVGDMIEGMGSVKDIRMMASGRWAVVTTGGTISSR